MKNYFNIWSKHPRCLLFMGAAVLLLATGVILQWRVLSRNQVDISKWQSQRAAAKELSERAARNSELLANNLAVLRQYEERIPFVDGYVWLNKFLNQHAPEVKLTVAPPEIGYELISIPDYCTGFFRLQGTSAIGGLTELLRTFEARLPFANVEEMQVQYVDDKKEQVKFSINLLMVMRLHQAPPKSNAASTVAAK